MSLSRINVHYNPGLTQSQLFLQKTKGSIANYAQQLSTGKRINSAADDAAGMGISEKYKQSIKAYGKAAGNAGEGVAMLGVAEGTLGTIHDILQRMRELSVQASNDTNTAANRTAMQNEFDALASELDRIAATTEFNGNNIFSAATTNVTLHIGAYTTGNDDISVNFTGTNTTTLAVNALSLTNQATAHTAMTSIATAIDTISATRASLGAIQNRLEYTITNLNVAIEKTGAANSQIMDADIPSVVTALTQQQALSQAGMMGIRTALKDHSEGILTMLGALQ